MTPAVPTTFHRSAIDRVASVALTALALFAAGVSLFFSPFFVMTTDACGPDECNDSVVAWAYAVTWGGVILAAVVAVAGMIYAARHQTVMWLWPMLATVLVVVTFVIGAQLASSVAPLD